MPAPLLARSPSVPVSVFPTTPPPLADAAGDTGAGA